MAKLLALAVLVPVLLHGAVGAGGGLAGEEQQEVDSVVALDSDSLEAALQKEEPMMVEFFAPWCGHCKKLEPEYAKAAQELRKDGLLLGKVDCDANEDLCDEDRWDIEGLPAVKVMRGGKGGPVHDYYGPRKAADIVTFMRQVAALPPPDFGASVAFDDDDFDSEDDEEDEEEFDLMEDDGVLVLGAHNFEAVTEHFILMLVLLYTPGCDDCAALMKEYVQASDDLYEHLIPVAKVDCFLQAELCQHPRWKNHAAPKPTGASADGAEPVENGGGTGTLFSSGRGREPPRMFVVREGDVFAYDGEPPFRAFDLVEFTKELAGIGDEEVETAENEVDETNVLVLDESSFESALAEKDVLLLEFFAPWCGNCQRLRPRYARAAAALAAEGSAARLAKIDCTENADLCVREPWRIDRYPTIMLRRFGKLYEFDEPPEAKEIVRFMRKATAPALHMLEDEVAVHEFVRRNEVAILGIMEKEGSEAHLKFREAAEADFGPAFGVTFEDKVADFFAVESGNKVVALRHFDAERLSMQIFSFTTTDAIDSFVKGASKKLYLKMGTDEADDILAARPVAMFLLTEEEAVPSDATKGVMEVAQTLAKKSLATAAVGKKAADSVVQYVHASRDEAGRRVMGFLIGEKNLEGQVPGAFIVAPGDDGKVIKYRHDGELTLEALEEFERRYFAGELRPHTKSEALSEEDELGLVKKVKATSFKRMVIDTDNDVLVDFYAPWCPHCKRLAPVYAELAGNMQGRENLVIADMDVTANEVDHPGVSTSKLPTLLMFKAGSKDTPERYEGDLELEPLQRFVNEMAAEAGDAPRRDEL
eukprot:g2556.t1